MINVIRKNILTIVTALLIMYLSLANSDSLDEFSPFDFPFLDKIVHFGMYFTLMMSILYEHRINKIELKSQLVMGIIPLLYGILLEFIQTYFTATRSGDFFDAVSNFTGIIVALIIWRMFFNLRKRKN